LLIILEFCLACPLIRLVVRKCTFVKVDGDKDEGSDLDDDKGTSYEEAVMIWECFTLVIELHYRCLINRYTVVHVRGVLLDEIHDREDEGSGHD
jgi:hypothetical protein